MGFDPVTAADRAAEVDDAHADQAQLPGDTESSAEVHGSERADAEYVWVLDPIDGTKSFITGMPIWGSLIGLTRNGAPCSA